MKKGLALVFLLLVSTFAFVFETPLITAQSTSQPSLTLIPSTLNATQLNQTITFNIQISNVQNLWGWVLNVTFDSNFLKYQNCKEGSFLTSQGAADLFASTKPQNYQQDSNVYSKQVVTMQDAIDSSSNGTDDSASGTGTLVTLTFQVVNQTSGASVVLGVEQLEGPNPTSAVAGTPHPNITPVSYSATAIVSLIIPGPPTANAGLQQTVPVGTPVALNGSGSVSSGSNTTYIWTFTDNTPQTLNGAVVNYTFNNPGNYTITLTVTDSLGTSNSTLLVYVIGNTTTATPTATATQGPNNNPTSSPIITLTSAPTPTGSTQQANGAFSLPPTVTGILVLVTVCTLVGSFFWLRKQTEIISKSV